jgi:hypothetical protein
VMNRRAMTSPLVTSKLSPDRARRHPLNRCGTDKVHG